MQVIAISAKDGVALSDINTIFLSEIDSQDIKITLIQDVKLLLQGFLMVTENLLY